MTITVYGIPNCDTVRKARKWLDARGIEHRFHDFRKDGLDADRVSGWLDAAGAEVLVNRRGTTWRKLDDADKQRIEGTGAAAALAENPTVIKRPVIEAGSSVLVGFGADTQSALEGGTG